MHWQWYSRTRNDAEPPNIRIDSKVSVRRPTTLELTVNNSHLSTTIGFAGIVQNTERRCHRCPASL